MSTNLRSLPRVSLLITTYNRFDALRLVLSTALNQSVVPDQIVICDDGSGCQTTSDLNALAHELGSRVSLIHTWQPDSLFRAARIRNLGLSRISTPYVIMIDGDCLLPYHFIERHLALAKKGWVAAGGRHLISAELSQHFLATRAVDFSRISTFKFAHIPLGALRDFRPRKWSQVRTCNLGLFMEDVLRVDGFDENYIGWGREDSDFVVRLLNSGIRIRSARLAATVAHLNHPEFDRAFLNENDIRFSSVLDDCNKYQATKSSLVGL